MPPYNHPEQVSCLLPNQETDHTKLYLLQAPQPLSTNRSTARIIPTSFPGTKDVRDSLLFKAIATGPLLQHSLLPQGHRPTAPQHEGGFSSSLTPTSSILWVQRHAPIFSSLKNSLTWLPYQPSSNSMFLSSKLFRRFYPKSMFSPSAHISIHSSLILSAEKAFSKTKLQKLSWWQSDYYLSQILYGLEYQPSCFWIPPNHCFCLTCQPLPPHQPPDKLGAPSPFHATHFLWENVNDYRLMNLNTHLQLILIRLLSWDADPSAQRPMSISNWRPAATSNQHGHQILCLPSNIFQLV